MYVLTLDGVNSLAGRDAPGYDSVDQREAFDALPPDDRAMVPSRLDALLRFRDAGSGVSAAAAAEEIGVSRPNLYRMVRRMDEVGPIRGLLRAHAKKRPSKARDGLGGEMDRLVLATLKVDPAASLSDVQRALFSSMEEVAPDLRRPVPHESTLRRRLNVLRGARAALPDRNAGLGAHLLLDRCVISASIGPDGRQAWLTALVDLETRMILGASVGPDDPKAALSSLLVDASVRAAMLADEGVPFAKRWLTLEWVVPDQLRSRVAEVGSAVPADRRPRIDPVTKGSRRTGVRLTRILSNVFGRFGLAVRPDALTAWQPEPYGTAEALEQEVFSQVRRWNAEIAAYLFTVGNRGRPATRARARTFVDDVQTALAPAIPDADLFA